ncbi:MAG: heparinase II/III family protein [Puniceicoccaceae bacterium]
MPTHACFINHASSLTRWTLLVLGTLALQLVSSAEDPPAFSFSTEVKRPDMTREAKDTAPKYNPTAHIRKTTKEEAGNYTKRDLLQKRYSGEAILGAIIDPTTFRPYPPAGDAAYQALPEEERAAIIEAAEAFLDHDWPTLRATDYLHFYETGSQVGFQKIYMDRLKTLETLLYAEILEGEGRFVRDIANGVWALCEQTSLAQPAHLNVELPGAGMPSLDHPILALLACEAAVLMATADYFFREELDALHPEFRKRMRYEVNRQILTPYLERTDYWWMAYEKPFTNNWNPWITSNYLLCAIVFSESREELVPHVVKAVDVLDRFLNVYPEDGGCEEGPAYWNHAGGRLLDCLELLGAATGGLIDLYDEPLVREMGEFMWYSSIHPPWYVNFADAFARYTPEATTLFRYGKAVGSENLMAFATTMPVKPYLSSWRLESVYFRQLPAIAIRKELLDYDRPFEPSTFVALPDLETAYVRQSTDTGSGFYLAAKGGYNAESHNHNDIGNFIIFLDGEPLLIDTGVGTYTSKTFSEQRYEIWSMQSSYHNLPDINGQPQPHMIQWRSDFFETRHSEDGATIKIGITSAYPEAANLADYTRTLRFDRSSERISILDSFAFRDGNESAGRNSITFHFMTHHVPSPGSEPGQVLLTHPETGTDRAILSCPTDLGISINKIVLKDPRMAESRGDTLYRIVVQAEVPGESLTTGFQFSIGRAE